jgi:hypothetical protein
MRNRLLRIVLAASLAGSLGVPTLAVTMDVGVSDVAAACSWEARIPTNTAWPYVGNIQGWGYLSGCGSSIQRVCVYLDHWVYIPPPTGPQNYPPKGYRCTNVGGWAGGWVGSFAVDCMPGVWYSVVQAYRVDYSGTTLIGTRVSNGVQRGNC